jgi:E2 binding domain
LVGAKVIDALVADEKLGASLEKPSVSYGASNLYMRGVLEEATRGNLSKPISQLVDGDGSIIQVHLVDRTAAQTRCTWTKQRTILEVLGGSIVTRHFLDGTDVFVLDHSIVHGF